MKKFNVSQIQDVILDWIETCKENGNFDIETVTVLSLRSLSDCDDDFIAYHDVMKRLVLEIYSGLPDLLSVYRKYEYEKEFNNIRKEMK